MVGWPNSYLWPLWSCSLCDVNMEFCVVALFSLFWIFVFRHVLFQFLYNIQLYYNSDYISSWIVISIYRNDKHNINQLNWGRRRKKGKSFKLKLMQINGPRNRWVTIIVNMDTLKRQYCAAGEMGHELVLHCQSYKLSLMKQDFSVQNNIDRAFWNKICDFRFLWDVFYLLEKGCFGWGCLGKQYFCVWSVFYVSEVWFTCPVSVL